MQLLNLNIDKIIIHQVYQRDVEGHKVTPMQSHVRITIHLDHLITLMMITK